MKTPAIFTSGRQPAALAQAWTAAQIAAALGMKRQVFFVSVGGFDTHQNQNAAQPGNPPSVEQGGRAKLIEELHGADAAVEAALRTAQPGDLIGDLLNGAGNDKSAAPAQSKAPAPSIEDPPPG